MLILNNSASMKVAEPESIALSLWGGSGRGRGVGGESLLSLSLTGERSGRLIAASGLAGSLLVDI